MSLYGLDETKIDLISISKYFMQDSIRSIVKCWWRSQEINCADMFVNQFLDIGSCFTFQTNKKVIENLDNSGKKCL